MPSNDDGESSSDELETHNEAESTTEPPLKRAKHMGKKKTVRRHLWKKNIASTKRNEGKSYVDRKGKMHMAKQVKPYDHNCRFKCNAEIGEDKRQKIFDEYWILGNWELQSSFLNSAIILNEPAKKKAGSQRQKSVSCQFYLAQTRVCKEFFFKTLDISNKRVTNVISKKKN